jgi:hypothetical protein
MEQVITLRTRKALPDVPEDIEVHLAHLNDPNYTFDSPDWSEDSFELEDKKAPIESPIDGIKPYNFDVETQSDYSGSSSRVATSRAPLQTDECVYMSLSFFNSYQP